MRFLSMLILSFVPLFSTETFAENLFDKKIDGVEYICRKGNSWEFCLWKESPDWILLDHDNGKHNLLNLGTPQDGYLWLLRSEFGKNKHSKITLFEVQCKQPRFRVVQIAKYTKPMMQGEAKTLINDDDKWYFIVPNSIAEIMMKLECGKFK